MPLYRLTPGHPQNRIALDTYTLGVFSPTAIDTAILAGELMTVRVDV